MLHPAFPPAGFAVSKMKQLQGILLRSSCRLRKPSSRKTMRFTRPGDPRRRHATAQSTAAISPADVRRWYASAFRPGNTTISVVGDVSPGRARGIVERYFGNWRASAKTL